MKYFLCLVMACIVSSCAPFTARNAEKRGSVDHVVMFWMKHPTNSAERQKIVDAIERLRAIECIDELVHGRALASVRPVVDDSFDIGLLVRFPDAASLLSYEDDPRHVKEVKEVLLPLTRKVVVYDVVR